MVMQIRFQCYQMGQQQVIKLLSIIRRSISLHKYHCLLIRNFSKSLIIWLVVKERDNNCITWLINLTSRSKKNMMRKKLVLQIQCLQFKDIDQSIIDKEQIILIIGWVDFHIFDDVNFENYLLGRIFFEFFFCFLVIFIYCQIVKIAVNMRAANIPLQSNNQSQVQQNNGRVLKEKTKQGQQQKKKKIRTISLKPQHFQTGKGLKKLYQLTNQIKWQDPMTIQSAMNLVVLTLKSWQYQLMPKYYHELFFQRCQALGSHKLITAYMSKVRKIHKGQAQWDGSISENIKTTPGQTVNKNRNSNHHAENDEGLHLECNDGHQSYQSYGNDDDQMNELQKFKQRVQLAQKLGNVSVSGNNPVTTQKTNQQQIDDMMDEDLRMFEEMRKRMNKMKKQNDKEEEDGGMELGGDSDVQFEDDGL